MAEKSPQLFSSLKKPVKIQENDQLKKLRKKDQGLSPSQSAMDSALEAVVSVPKGFLGIDPGKEEREDYPKASAVNYATQMLPEAKELAAATKVAALPMAIPRVMQQNLIESMIEAQRKYLSPRFRDALSQWTMGSAMHSPTRNRQLAERLRENPDREIIQEILRQKLRQDTVPGFRGIKGDDLAIIKNDIAVGRDPGARSFSMEPKVTHQFADPNVPWIFPGRGRLDTTHPAIRGRRGMEGQFLRGEVPVEKVLGVGGIDDQRELIFDMQGIDPDTQLKVLRENLPDWMRQRYGMLP